MKKIIFICCFLLSATAFTKDIHEGMKVKLRSDMDFLFVDHAGVLNIIDLFSNKVTLAADEEFEVVSIRASNVHSELIQGRMIRSCSRSIDLKITDCRLANDLFMQQIIEFGSPQVELDLITKNDSCLVRFQERLSVFCDSKETIVKDSRFFKFFK